MNTEDDHRRRWVAAWAGPVMVGADCGFTEAVDRLVAVCEEFGFAAGVGMWEPDIEGAIRAAIDR